MVDAWGAPEGVIFPFRQFDRQMQELGEVGPIVDFLVLAGIEDAHDVGGVESTQSLLEQSGLQYVVAGD